VTEQEGGVREGDTRWRRSKRYRYLEPRTNTTARFQRPQRTLPPHHCARATPPGTGTGRTTATLLAIAVPAVTGRATGEVDSTRMAPVNAPGEGDCGIVGEMTAATTEGTTPRVAALVVAAASPRRGICTTVGAAGFPGDTASTPVGAPPLFAAASLAGALNAAAAAEADVAGLMPADRSSAVKRAISASACMRLTLSSSHSLRADCSSVCCARVCELASTCAHTCAASAQTCALPLTHDKHDFPGEAGVS